MKKITVALLLSLCLFGCGKKDEVLPKHHVDVLKVAAYNVPYQFDYPASISGVADFPVVPRVSGTLFKQIYTEGTYVKAGQPLYEIDKRPFQIQLKADEGQLIKDSTQMVEYKSILDRYVKLYPIGGVAKQDVETATINYKNAVGQVQTDKATIKQDKLNIQYCTVEAPVSGLISERVVTIGTMVVAFQTTLNNINTKDNMFVNFSVPENDRLNLQEGINNGTVIVPNDYKFTMNLELADGTMLKSVGTVSFFDTRISLQDGTWNMRGDVDNKGMRMKLLSGQFVHVYLLGAEFKNAFAIPQAAVFRDNDGAFVYLLKTGNKIEKQRIVTGVMSGQLWVIQSGLKPGDVVVTNGGIKVMPGDKVIVDSSADQAKTLTST